MMPHIFSVIAFEETMLRIRRSYLLQLQLDFHFKVEFAFLLQIRKRF